MRPIAIFVTMVLVIAAARKAKKKFPSGSGAKAAQSAGLGAALFMGIGGLRGGKMGANGKMQYNPGWESGSMIGVFQRIVYCIAVSVVTLCVVRVLNVGVSTKEPSNLWVIHSTVHMYQPRALMAKCNTTQVGNQAL
jgi:NADH:ubiquinone oxidoreductase subunit 6 (subunit J)